MSTFCDPEELVPCPYDPVHMVARKRMQYHLMKCRKNFDYHDYKTCPFNARHVLPKPEFEYHIRECPDRARVDAEMLQRSRQKDPFQLKGCTDMPVSDWAAPVVSESWDDDNVTYVPPSHDGLISSNEPAEREERLSPKRREPPKEVVKEPPQPRMPQMGAPMDSQVYNYSMASMKEQRPSSEVVRTHPIGLGRGRGSGRGSAPPGFQRTQGFMPQQPVGVMGRGVSGVPMMGAGRGVAGVPMMGAGVSVNGVPMMGAGRGVAGVPMMGAGVSVNGVLVLGAGRGAAGVMERPVQPSTLVHPVQPPRLPGPPPGFGVQVMPSGAVAQPAVQGMSEEELQKRERKLRKMLRQIESLELRLSQGEQLDSEALAKISRKGDVLDKIEEIEKLKRRRSL